LPPGGGVDALVVAVGAVGGQGGVVLASRPLVEQVALAGVVIERHRIAAGVGDALDFDHDNGTGAAAGREPGRDLLPAVVSGHHQPALPVQPQNPRRAGEGAEYEGDAPVVAQVGGGLGAAAGEVQVGDGLLVQDGEGVGVALWARG
jgi:hypothetical protein